MLFYILTTIYFTPQLGISGEIDEAKPGVHAERLIKELRAADGSGDPDRIMEITRQLAEENSRLAARFNKKESAKKAFDKKALDEYELTGNCVCLLPWFTCYRLVCVCCAFHHNGCFHLQ